MQLLQQITQTDTPWYREIQDLFWSYYDWYSSTLIKYQQTENYIDYARAYEIVEEWAKVSELLKDSYSLGEDECSCYDLPDGRGYTCPICDIRAQAQVYKELLCQT